MTRLRPRAMAAEVNVEHAYPAAFAFVRRHGPQALAVLHDLLAHAESRGDDLVVRASVRQVAGRLGFASKDTVHRQVRMLIRAGVLERLGTEPARFEPPAYRVVLAGTGIRVTLARADR